jgi:hypothetical protein
MRLLDLFSDVGEKLGLHPRDGRAPQVRSNPDQRGGPAVWLIDSPLIDAAALEALPIDFDVPAGRPDLLEAPQGWFPDGDPDISSLSGRRAWSADHVAVYRPWHFYGATWGIYLIDHTLIQHTRAIAVQCGVSPSEIAAAVRQQIIDHERAHATVEVAATLLEDARTTEAYRPYALTRFHTPTSIVKAGGGVVVPLEEAFATWREVRSRRLPDACGKPPIPFWSATQAQARLAGAGYMDWDTWGHDPAAAARALMSLVADATIASESWLSVDRAVLAQVPVYWVGDPASARLFGGIPKSRGLITIPRLRRWLARAHNGVLVTGGKGSHELWETGGGLQIRFATSAGFLLHPEEKAIRQAFGLSREDLFRAVMGA